jgi:hypothetical protein
MEAAMVETSADERIRARAQQLWEQAGRPEGRQDEFWYQAQQDIREMEKLREQAEAPPPMILPG